MANIHGSRIISLRDSLWYRQESSPKLYSISQCRKLPFSIPKGAKRGEEGTILHTLQALEINDRLWSRVNDLGSNTEEFLPPLVQRNTG